MESRGPPATSYWLLLLLLLLLLSPPYIHQGWALGHILSTQRAQDPPSRYLSSGPGQGPVAVMTFDFTKITKTSSSFEFRAWDPEGVIFYGDTDTEEDWFMLGLRDGRLEIQLHNHWGQLTVGVGPRLDEGKWHQLVPALDGCVCRECWLGQQTQPSASVSTGLRSCNVELQPGLFFPPGTRAEFSLQDIPQPHSEPWAFSLDLGLKLAAGSGHLLGLGAQQNSSWLSLHLQDQQVVLSSGARPRLELPMALGLLLQLKLAASTVVLKQGSKTEVFAMLPEDLAPVLKLWTQLQGRLFLGALPVPSPSRRGLFCLLLLEWPLGTRTEAGHGLGPEQKLGYLDS
ncbi:sex hormone-binding globulin isoform X2 [Heterocephalus glaber]|uniref:Sex hormone-binding globulin n=1 Tax=Heterocephalus glaber TaxID=10181 RepID=A0AAX6REU1_HETGA|nr:sex hormone-binding globulin isoform X2 [Heterocephalus glaber]